MSQPTPSAWKTLLAAQASEQEENYECCSSQGNLPCNIVQTASLKGSMIKLPESRRIKIELVLYALAWASWTKVADNRSRSMAVIKVLDVNLPAAGLFVVELSRRDGYPVAGLWQRRTASAKSAVWGFIGLEC